MAAFAVMLLGALRAAISVRAAALLAGVMLAGAAAAQAVMPVAPTIDSVVPGNQHLTFNFTPDPTTPAQSDYWARCVSGIDQFDATGTSSPLTVTGLTNGTPYSCTVDVCFPNGGSCSESFGSIYTPVATAPAAPTATSATPGNGQATIAFTPPADDGGSPITGYTATCTSGAVSGSAGGSGSPITVPGLTNGLTYSCTVTATNNIGTSGPSNALSVALWTLPGAPTIAGITPGDGSALVDIIPPSDTGGAPITGYQVTCDLVRPGPGEVPSVPLTGAAAPTSVTVIGTTTSVNVPGLVNGRTYSCRAAAINPVGTGPYSLPKLVTLSQSAQVNGTGGPTAPLLLDVTGVYAGPGGHYLAVIQKGTTLAVTDNQVIGSGSVGYDCPADQPALCTGLLEFGQGLGVIDDQGHAVVDISDRYETCTVRTDLRFAAGGLTLQYLSAGATALGAALGTDCTAAYSWGNPVGYAVVLPGNGLAPATGIYHAAGLDHDAYLLAIQSGSTLFFTLNDFYPARFPDGRPQKSFQYQLVPFAIENPVSFDMTLTDRNCHAAASLALEAGGIGLDIGPAQALVPGGSCDGGNTHRSYGRVL